MKLCMCTSLSAYMTVNIAQWGSSDRGQVVTLSRNAEAAYLMPELLFFCGSKLDNWSFSSVLSLVFWAGYGEGRLHGEGWFLLDSQLQFVWVHCDQADFEWRKQRLRLGNADTFMHMLTEHSGSALRDCHVNSPQLLRFHSPKHVKSSSQRCE